MEWTSGIGLLQIAMSLHNFCKSCEAGIWVARLSTG